MTVVVDSNALTLMDHLLCANASVLCRWIAIRRRWVYSLCHRMFLHTFVRATKTYGYSLKIVFAE